MLVNEVLLEADKEYDLTVPTKYLEKGPDKGMFKKGRKGKIKHAVQQIQFFLSAKGYKYRVKNKSGKVITGLPKPDGWYGAKTASAVRAFQKDKGLKPDGDVGKNTLLAMIQTDTPDLSDKVDSAELTSKVYPKDYIEQQYKKLKKDPDSAKQLFATKPDMTDALKATLQGILKATRADKGDDVRIFNLPMIVNMRNIDMVLKNTDEKIIQPKFRPIWIDQLIKGLTDAAVHARISPEYIKKVEPIIQELNKIDKEKIKKVSDKNNNWTQQNLEIDFETMYNNVRRQITEIDTLLTKTFASKANWKKMPPKNKKEILALVNRTLDVEKTVDSLDPKNTIDPAILNKIKDYYIEAPKMIAAIQRARKAGDLNIRPDIGPSYSPSDDGTRSKPVDLLNPKKSKQKPLIPDYFNRYKPKRKPNPVLDLPGPPQTL